MKRVAFCIAFFLGFVIYVTGQQMTVNSKARGLRTLQEAFANPFDEDKFQALKVNLPRDQNLYVVEGDLLLTEQELRAYIVGKSQSERPIDTSAELVVNVHKGRRDYYEDPGSRILSYAVDRRSFPEEEMYKSILENMQIAVKDWESACPECKIQFKFNSGPAPSTESVNFVVRYRDVKGSYIAAAFFPHDGPDRRYLNIDPSYFKTSVDKVGVLRHELGHVLGYRHEQTRGVLGCYYEDDRWQPLTEYDPKSVMHYFCGGGGDLRLSLSDLDKAGHRKLYTLSNANNPVDSKRYVRVRFEGSEILKTMPQVLQRLTDLGLIQTRPYVVTRDGETLKSIYEQNFGLWLISGGMLDYAAQINKDLAGQKLLKINDEVRYPNVQFKPRSKLVVLDKNSESDQQIYKRLTSIWPVQLVSEVRKDENTIALSLTSYELNLEFDSENEETRARAELTRYKHELKARYLVLGSSSISSQSPAIYSFGQSVNAHSPSRFADTMRPLFGSRQTPRQFMDEVNSKGGKIDAGIEADLSLYLGETPPPPSPSPCDARTPPNCPEIILVDKAVTKHPDIPDGITQGVSPARPIDSSTTPNQQVIRIGNQGILDSQHGTYMAGIIASQENDFGLIGVYPTVKITPYDWDGILNPSDPERRDELIRGFAEFIHNRQARYHNDPSSSSMPVFVFATEWKFEAEPNKERKESDRFDSSQQENPDPWREVAAAIFQARPLLVVAAGQPTSSVPERQRISTLSLEGPRNLGDLENVIVVTAMADDPVTGRPTLWSDANFIAEDDQQKLIHVAAPGLQILSTVPGTGPDLAAFYAVASGTSQATAFVAAVVARMIAAYPDQYKDPHVVKTRLQVTSNPFLKRPDAGKLAAGIIDFSLAMHDPRKDWFKKKGESGFVDVSNLRWLVENINLEVVDRNNHPQTVQITTNKIYRIMFRDDVCYVYTNDRKNGQIKKYGPGRLKASNVNNLKLFELKAGTGGLAQYALGQIEDLVLSVPFVIR